MNKCSWTPRCECTQIKGHCHRYHTSMLGSNNIGITPDSDHLHVTGVCMPLKAGSLATHSCTATSARRLHTASAASLADHCRTAACSNTFKRFSTLPRKPNLAFNATSHNHITTLPTMATQDATTGVCAACGQPATTHCGGCAGVEVNGTRTLTLYCGKTCQTNNWTMHKKACQAAQGRKKLFRAAEIIQEAFFALRAEVFDLNVTKVERDKGGNFTSMMCLSKGARATAPQRHVWMEISTSSAVSSLTVLAVTSSLMLSTALARRLSRVISIILTLSYQSGFLTPCIGYTTKVEEVDLRVFDSRVLLHRHYLGDTAVPVSQNIHHVIYVTLKDGTAWAVDPAGAQHGQNKPVVPFDEYNRDFVAKILARRPHGDSKVESERFTIERHPRDTWNIVALQMYSNLEHVEDEVEEWQLTHTSIENIIKTNSSDYQRLKSMLVDHLATAAREFLKYINGDPTSTTKLIDLNAPPNDLSEEDRLRMERKRHREMAAMHPSHRELMESQKAMGTTVLMC